MFREMDNDRDRDSDLFGSDYSDVDPDYREASIDGSDSETEENRSKNESEPPAGLDKENTDPEHKTPNESQEVVVLILDEILNKVWLCVKPLKRRREAKPEEWKKNISKIRKAEGLPYTSKGKLQPAKIPKNVNCENCKFKCSDFFSEDDRNALCRHFYSLDYVNKKNYILSCITIHEIKTQKVHRSAGRKARTFSKKCYFTKNSVKIQVCQKFFTGTLCISVDVISDAVAKSDNLAIYKSEDKRGKKAPPNKTKEDDVQFVREHIESFPLIDSHYCRKDSKKRYLASEIKSVTNMYRLYMERCEESERTAVSEYKYRSIFCEDYNISFFKPKKDQCNICSKYNKANDDTKATLESGYQDHISRKNISSLAKEADKAKSNKDTTLCLSQ
jgi:hypothetical protein